MIENSQALPMKICLGQITPFVLHDLMTLSYLPQKELFSSQVLGTEQFLLKIELSKLFQSIHKFNY